MLLCSTKLCTPKLRKHSAQFNSIVLRMEIFHTICTFLAVIGKRFQDAGLGDVCLESGVIADGSAAGVLEGRAIRLHRIMFEALNRLAWNGFQLWIEEHHKAKKPHVNELMKGLKQLIDTTCEPKFKFVMKSHLFQEVSHLFLSYSHHLRHSNGKFWMSYVDMIEVLLGLIRATRERN